jgi:hypothetical protein
MKLVYIPAVVLLALALLGCGQSRDPNLPDLVPVSGQVTLDGNPLANASLMFVPTGSTPGTGSGAVTDAKGKYELRTSHDGIGAPVGQYKVIISKLVLSDGSDYKLDSGVSPMDAGADESLPAQYSDPDQTILTANVPEGGGPIDFPLNSKP